MVSVVWFPGQTLLVRFYGGFKLERGGGISQGLPVLCETLAANTGRKEEGAWNKSALEWITTASLVGSQDVADAAFFPSIISSDGRNGTLGLDIS